MTEPLLIDSDYKRLADFRYALRRFLHFSERAAAQEGLKPQQHQALLAIRGREAGTTTVGVLAERLKLRHHTTVELVQRLEAAGLVSKRPSPEDRRAMVLELTLEGSARLERLSRVHRTELKHLGPEIVNFLSTLDPS
ncbi:MarR family transcriptional regulator [Luteolibacter ambystomatis]|uniref:MarR family transcriptional regulator n=1 Tax=Luteolibacter ambystomatis TaxID=2824561 RepID=A0A975IYX6_9BACT|nr:helix-turn-helix domain-containing protein [Luteolibacter ambystomatis]QUE50866.1 MarR family transcriptional regulator [Luteolibacter ambystomatis]